MADHSDSPPSNLSYSTKLASPDKTHIECSLSAPSQAASADKVAHLSPIHQNHSSSTKKFLTEMQNPDGSSSSPSDKTHIESAPIQAASADKVAHLSPIHQNHSSSTKKSLTEMQNPDGSSSSPSDKTLSKPPSVNSEDNEFIDVKPAQISSASNTKLFQFESNSDSYPFYPRPDSSPPLRYIANSEYEREDELSWSFIKIKPTGVGAGLYNSGNTCFIAAVLQCFTHSVPLIKSLTTYEHQNPCNCGNDKFCVMQALHDHISLAIKSSGYNLYIDEFRLNLNHFSSEFLINHQEDAQEFLQSFLDKLERCCLDPRNRPGSSSSQDVNIVDNVFGGRLMSTLRCCNCDSVSNTFEASLGLSLEIEDAENLWSALDSFTCVEELEDQLLCDNCKEMVSKEKQLQLDKLPPVATFHLKRFKNDGTTMKKISNHVEFPLELDLYPYMSRSSQRNPEVSTRYHLYAFVEHGGVSPTFGHYTSYVRSAPEIWHHFNDSKVRRIPEDCVLSQEAYILFYAREGTPWFSTVFEQLKPVLNATPVSFSPTSVLDGTYEDVGHSNKACNDLVGVSIPEVISCHGPQEDVFHRAESSSDDDDTVMIANLKPPEADKSEKLFAETPQQREPESFPAADRANIDDADVPELKVQNQNLSPKRKAGEKATLGGGPKHKIPKSNSDQKRPGSFQIQRAHLQTKKEDKTRRTKLPASAADPKDTKYARSYLNRMQTSRARTLAKALDSSPMEKENLVNIR